MANSFVRYTGNGSTTAYSIPFSYRSTADLTVTLAGVATTAFTLNAAGTTVTFNTAPANNVAIEIRRRTSQGTKLVDYASGSVLTESDLDTDSDQAFFMSQEAIDDAGDVIKIDATNFQWNATNKRITNVANPTSDQDVATKHYLENTWLSSSDKANINTLAGITNLGTLASNETNINTVATNNTNVTNVGSNINNVNTVANNMASVNTVATDIAKVITVANDLNETVSEIETAALDLQETTSEIDTVANNIANVNTVGNAIANVNLVGNDIANVNLVANNVSGVNSFAERYRILSSAPTTSNDVGDLYFDTTANELKVYKPSGWAAAGSTVNGTANRFEYTATAGQTTFTGADTNGATMAYDAGFIDVYLNGVKLANADFTATTGTSVVLASGASVNDILMVVAYGTFQLANISVNDLTDTPAALGTAGQALVVNAGATALEYANASSAEVYGFEKFFSPSTLTRTVTFQNVGGANKYFIDGVQQDTLELHEGNTYIFDWSSATGHPFRFSTTADGTHGGGSEYTTGVTVDTSNYKTTIVVASGAPTLYYYCQYHSGMGGQANTPTPANNSVRVITTNQGVDNISASQYANFDDVQFAASGFTWSLNNGELIATI
tara:strand:- start:2259 stop:4106 length:1848 start_codon:yes stop_codon:yes gene_type:complete